MTTDNIVIPRKLLVDAINFISICQSPKSVGESAFMILQLNKLLEPKEKSGPELVSPKKDENA